MNLGRFCIWPCICEVPGAFAPGLGEVTALEISKTDIEKLIHFVPGDVAVYQYDGGLQTLYNSVGRPAVLGFTNGEYDVLTSGDALDIVFKDDRPFLKKQILACLDGTRESECTYRIFHKDKGFFWVHARAKRIGEMNGCPVILAVLIDASTETKLYETLLKNTETRVFVIDRENLSLLYTNSPAFGGRECLNDTDYTCYNYIRCRDKVCDDCFLKDVRSGKTLTTKRTVSSEGRVYSVRTSLINWYGHEAFAQFVEDITERSLAQQKPQSEKADLKL